jgi:hypothetical protein
MVAKNGLAGYRQTTNAWRFRCAALKFCSVSLRKTSPCVKRCFQCWYIKTRVKENKKDDKKIITSEK